MVCREPLLGGAQTFGMETVRAFGSAYWFGPQSGREGPWVAPLFTAGNLFYLAILTYMASKKAPGKPSLLRNLTTAYMVITGIVELTRFVWDVARFALVWAALHNLAEWGVIGFTVFKAKDADAHWWRSQLWVLAVSQVILFAPTITEGGGFEQIVGLTCDWLLLGVWSLLYHKSDARKREYVIWGLLGAVGHMLEILPLVSLLIGLVKVPSTWGCILISFTTPITFYCYHRMVQGFDESGDKDLVTGTSKSSDSSSTSQDLSVSIRAFSGMVVIALVCSCATILGPAKIIPLCAPAQMEVSPGQVLSHEAAAVTAATDLTGTRSGIPRDGGVPAVPGATTAATNCPFAGASYRASNESLCPSHTKLTGTTTIVAKPGLGAVMRDMIATMPGPIRQEDGNLYYEEAFGGTDGLTVKFFESWSSIRSLYKHIYSSPAVARVFFSEAFANVLASQKLEGPFQAMIPCSEAEKEAEPVSIPMSTIIDAPVECLWDKIDAWGTDHTWVQGAQGITPVTDFLRVLHFKSTDVPVIRQTKPLANTEQPANGHRLVYYMLGGGFMDTIGEVYKGDLTIVPSAADPSKTLFTYTATIVAKDPSLTAKFYDTVNNDFKSNRIPFLQNWGRGVAATPKCKAAHPQVPSTPNPALSPTPSPTPTPAPQPATASLDFFYIFKLPEDRPATSDTLSLIKYLLSKQPAATGVAPEVLYAANIGPRNFPAAKVPVPDMKKPWNVTLVVRFPVGCTVPPAAVGAGIATDSYRVEVRPKPLPSPGIAATCPDGPALDQAVAAVKHEVDAMFKNFRKWSDALKADPTNPKLPVRPDAPMSGINLLQFKSGVIGQPCYQRYLLEAYKLIHSYGGGLFYFADVVKDGAESWDEIVIPLYNTGKVFFQVVFDPAYHGLLGLRDATLTDQANIDVVALPGTVMLIP